MTELMTADRQRAREELGRFFVLADLADRAPEMFSAFIDAEWHRLLDTDAYSTFCQDVVGHQVGHVADAGTGEVTWIHLYHQHFGTLPAEWFAGATGAVDASAYRSYLTTRTRAVDAGPLITAWDCTPTTGDPDHHDTDLVTAS